MRSRSLLGQILAVNSILILATVFAASVAARLDVSTVAGRRQFGVLAVAMLLTVLANAFLLRRRFAPLESIIDTMERVDLATPGVRAEPTGAEPEDVLRLQSAFNRMLARVEQERAEGASAVLRAQENERARLARDLHDEANQALTGLLLRFGAMRQDAPPALVGQLRDAQGVAQQAMEELLRLARELRPAALDDHGLHDALRTQVERFGAASGLTATIDLPPGLDESLDPDEALVAYRVVQEGLSNVTRHSGASHVHVEVRRRDGRTVVRVVDDGRGIPMDATAGAGLTGMRERALLVAGRLRVHSSPGRGTTVELVVGEDRPSVGPPLRRPAAEIVPLEAAAA